MCKYERIGFLYCVLVDNFIKHVFLKYLQLFFIIIEYFQLIFNILVRSGDIQENPGPVSYNNISIELISTSSNRMHDDTVILILSFDNKNFSKSATLI